jgi:predicted kinase
MGVMTKKLILIRGIPGSGKTTLAKNMVKQSSGSLVHFEADMFFIDDDGLYRFDSAKLADAHRWCEKQTQSALETGRSVVVSNTFVQRWEMQAYVDMTDEMGITLQVIECHGNYKSTHNVPARTIIKMKHNWETI